MFIQSRWRSGMVVAAILTAGFCTLAGLTGCQNTSNTSGKLTEIREAYDARDFNKAYQLGTWASRGRGPASEQAAYMAGMSAYKLGHMGDAINYLAQAGRSSDQGMAGDALATMGLIYAQQNNHALAAKRLLEAASRLEGQPKANAYFYAAISQQKIGRWSEARSHLSLARAASSDPLFKSQVDEQFSVTGYSLQVGAFSDLDNARKVAQQWAAKVQGKSISAPRLVPQKTADGVSVVAVQVGQFSSYTTALLARQDLADPTIIVVPLR